jgi:uncharacterized C2H2 Zn-finger protein
MTINRAIEHLKEIQARHGDIEVYFDCPNCKQSFTPDVVVPVIIAHARKSQRDLAR